MITAGRFAAFLLTTVALAGCPCPGYRQPIFHEDFESCDAAGGSVCGFSPVSGQATLGDGFTPGEHVLRLESGAVVERSGTVQSYSGSYVTSAAQLTLLARCESGASLAIDQLVAQVPVSTDGGVAVPRISAANHTMYPSTAWASYTVTLGGSTSAASDSAASTQQNQLFRLQVGVVGSGACELDLVQYDASNPYGSCAL